MSKPTPTTTAGADERPLLKVADVAKRYRCSNRQVFRLVARGDLPAVRLPGTRSLRFLPHIIDAGPQPRRLAAA
jgi:hypothetical protein